MVVCSRQQLSLRTQLHKHNCKEVQMHPKSKWPLHVCVIKVLSSSFSLSTGCSFLHSHIQWIFCYLRAFHRTYDTCTHPLCSMKRLPSLYVSPDVLLHSTSSSNSKSSTEMGQELRSQFLSIFTWKASSVWAERDSAGISRHFAFPGRVMLGSLLPQISTKIPTSEILEMQVAGIYLVQKFVLIEQISWKDAIHRYSLKWIARGRSQFKTKGVEKEEEKETKRWMESRTFLKGWGRLKRIEDGLWRNWGTNIVLTVFQKYMMMKNELFLPQHLWGNSDRAQKQVWECGYENYFKWKFTTFKTKIRNCLNQLMGHSLQ